jgi:hypothetical protein
VSTGRSRVARLRHVAVDVRPLRQPDFRRLFIGQGVSFVGYRSPPLRYRCRCTPPSSLWVGVIGIAGPCRRRPASWAGPSRRGRPATFLHRLLVPGAGRDGTARPGLLTSSAACCFARRRAVAASPVLTGAGRSCRGSAERAVPQATPELHDEQRRHRDRSAAGRRRAVRWSYAAAYAIDATLFTTGLYVRCGCPDPTAR